MQKQNSKIMISETERQHPMLTEKHRVLNRFRESFIILLLLGFLLPILSFAAHEGSGVSAPQTLEEAKNLGLEILSKLPESVRIFRIS